RRPAWEAGILPLNYARMVSILYRSLPALQVPGLNKDPGRMKTSLPPVRRLLLLVLGVAALSGCQDPKSRVVLYCAQDMEFAQASLDDFEKRSGVHVEAKPDTEKDKSVSLYLELV